MLQASLTTVFGIAIVIALIAIVLLWSGKGWFTQWLKGTVGFLLLASSIWTLLLLWDLWTYRAVVAEHPLATVSVYEIGEQEYDLTLVDSDGNEQRFKILGDQWQLDVRLLVWRGPLLGLGLEPLYRLDRLSGRYLSLEQELSAARTVYSLSEAKPFDIWNAIRNYDMWLDAEFGSAVYMPLLNGAVYSVHRTSKGLIARPLNDVAESALLGYW